MAKNAHFHHAERCLERLATHQNEGSPALPERLYDRWSGREGPPTTLHERDLPPEMLLQAVWMHQRLLRDRLQTLDGRQVRVLHPGFWNREAGPDFERAVIQIGDDPPINGDVEIDVEFAGWRGHGHDRDPNFTGVILHVIWEEPATDAARGAKLPQLVLRPFLDAPIEELATSLSGDTARMLPEELGGRCMAPLKDLSGEAVVELLKQGALCRLQMKAAQFNARARQVGWEQSLWEGLFRALGYKQNPWPMQRIAELLPELGHEPGANPLSARIWQARLLGVSGLLPDGSDESRADPATRRYVRETWDQWWRERDRLADAILPRSLWKMSSLRPANHPQRRLALAAHWLARPELPARIVDWFSSPLRDGKLVSSLLAVLKAGTDEFWEAHWTLRSKAMKSPQPLLGETRATDIAVNVILPWFWTRCASGGDERLRRTAERRYFAWPKAQDNAALRLARQRLLGGAHARRLTTAAIQQGLMQVVRDFCCHSNAICEDCRFPDLVKSLGQAGR